jgi:hypothetical protein
MLSMHEKTVRRSLLAAILSVVPATALSVVWWLAWMYRGWPGAPKLLRHFISADGEGAYDLVHLDMFLVLLTASFLVVLWALGRASASTVRIVSLAGFAVFLVPAFLLAAEAVYVGFIATPMVVAEYHFGSESMVGHGGWAYQSRYAYLAHGLLWSAALSAAALFLIWSAQRARRGAAV